jgi:8-oxo-dGTP pyrophosphatase MutT (NUDIX family)
VIVGCRDAQGRWLLIRRGAHVAAPLQVCFPGGAIEPGEDRDAAAIREMREELGLEVALLRQVWRHDFDDRPLTLWGYIAQTNSQTPTPDPYEVAEVLYLTTDEVCAHPDAMPMTDAFVRALQAVMDA